MTGFGKNAPSESAAGRAGEVQYRITAALALLPLFHVCNAYYKAVDHQPIGVRVLIPRELPNVKRPLLVRIHGGAFSEGTSDSWLRPWILELALKHKAILVTPDYRLRPGAQFTEIIDDMRDFWKSVETSLPQLPGIEVDISDLAIVGESGGGTLTAQTALLDMIRPIRVIMCKRFADAQKHPHLDPIKNLEKAGPLPPVFLFHGRGDTSVRVSDAETWADKLKRLQPDVPLHLVLREGEHCFDQSDTLATPWLRDPIEFVERYWPAKPYDMRSVLSC
ncbi:putative Alpha/Beta hydrolase protein [Seiridium unicorne]|uniref:Alpha/Beta hydrolase protein n=1 Tax=Seiridium unicorne TaxID=138068 RepID=A0ABR2ULM8_9PEZI